MEHTEDDNPVIATLVEAKRREIADAQRDSRAMWILTGFWVACLAVAFVGGEEIARWLAALLT